MPKLPSTPIVAPTGPSNVAEAKVYTPKEYPNNDTDHKVVKVVVV